MPSDLDSPLQNALRLFKETQARLAGYERAQSEPIAVIGMGCRFPGGENPGAFWRLLRAGVDKVSFAGSPGAARKVLAVCADSMTPVVIEGGGKDAMLVHADARLDEAAAAAVYGAMLNAGRPYLTKAWWLTFFPGVAIVTVGVACTLLGRAITRRERFA